MPARRDEPGRGDHDDRIERMDDDRMERKPQAGP